MTILFLILIVLASVILGFIILVQNPKGGGLSGSIAGFNNQFMGVKQTNDVLEKGTWIFSILIALLCIFSTFFMTSSAGSNDNDILNKINTSQGTSPSRQAVPTTPQQTAPPASSQTK
ncbi:preprotein translocase subunit SecG [Segetibacter aerophilus]|uniref:Protein-export membrane protein SecG n=1 Tax=Segetibacter aerophilus TaxID=670293 RepID=A0A512B9J4_9BACT|nr:preprotein translocase subunit SecG [Segetibacter aerophilus]GEO08638.1 preprotein translocase subunit SecG [Segetibacter aerophilus]